MNSSAVRVYVWDAEQDRCVERRPETFWGPMFKPTTADLQFVRMREEWERTHAWLMRQTTGLDPRGRR